MRGFGRTQGGQASPVLLVAFVVTLASAGCGSVGPWTLVASAPDVNPAGAPLRGIACTSADECWAVGGSSIFHYYQAAWTTEGAQTDALASVACPDPADCWAVASLGGDPLVLRDTDGHWGPDAAAASLDVDTSENGLSGIACPSISECWAVGEAPYVPLIAGYRNGLWTRAPNLIPPAGPGHQSFLSAVACANTTDCWAVGAQGSGGLEVPLIAQDLSGVWSESASPSLPDSATAVLDAITCSAPSECWAVGTTQEADGATLPLIERLYQGVWSVVQGASIPAASGTDLSGVACVDADRCWAVGYEGAGPDAVQQLIEEYSGAKWSIVDGASPGGAQASQLHSVACAPGGACWAVGSADSSDGSSLTLIEQTR